MDMVSISTNPGALIALQNLSDVTARLEETQRRVSTGLEISSARDNPALFTLAQQQRGELGSIESVQQGLRSATSTVDVALAAAEGISDVLVELRTIASQAAGASDAEIDSLETQYAALTAQIDRLIRNAEIGGRNLLDGTGSDLVVVASTDGSDTITIERQNLAATGGTAILTIDRSADAFTVPAGAPAGTTRQDIARDQIDAIDVSLTRLSDSIGALGAGSRSLDLQDDLLTRISNAVEISIGNLVDADLARESSRLQALQVQQQLAIQTLSIANAAPNAILALFA